MPAWNPATWAITNKLQGQPNPPAPTQFSGFSGGSEGWDVSNPSGGGATWGEPEVAVAPAYSGPSAAEIAARNAARNAISTTQTGYEGGARQSLTDVGNTYDQKTRGFLTDLETGQGDINTGFAGNQLNLRTSMGNIVKGIQQGVRSGGVALAGMNAMDSGASDALARAYAKVGNTQTGEARGEAAGVAEDLQRKQGQLNTKRNDGVLDLNTYRDTETGRVRNDFGSKLDTLGVQAEGQGIGDVVNRGLVDQVINEAMTRLNGITASRDQRLAGIRQWTPDEIMKEALRLEAQGQAGNAFDVEGPNVNYRGGANAVSGAPLGQLPIYVKGRDELAVVPRREDQLTAA